MAVESRPPTEMTDNDLLDEFETIVRQGRNFGAWDRERLRAVVTELSK